MFWLAWVCAGCKRPLSPPHPHAYLLPQAAKVGAWAESSHTPRAASDPVGPFLRLLSQPPQGGKRQTEVAWVKRSAHSGRRRWPAHPRGQQAWAGGLAVITTAYCNAGGGGWRRPPLLLWAGAPGPRAVPRGRCVLRSAAAKGKSLRPRGAPLRVGCCPGSQILGSLS